MSDVIQLFETVESQARTACRCGRPLTLVNSLMNIKTRQWVRLFECRSCGERTWDERR
ncbi:MAG: hypothetical protein ABW006_08785 [Hyphomicrobium sp.]